MRRIEQKLCVLCGSQYETRTKAPKREKYCSEKCRTTQHNRNYQAKRPKPDRTRTCVICSKTFQAPVFRPKALTCSKRCNQKRQDERRKPIRRMQWKELAGPPRDCVFCGNSFQAKKYGGFRQRYCSKQCREARNQALYLHRFPKEIRNAKNNKNKWSGNWQKALTRDAYCCKVCNATTGLTVHHLDGFGSRDPKPNHGLENLLTVCYSCNKKFHNITYRVIDGEVHVSGFVFDWFNVGQTVKVLR